MTVAARAYGASARPVSAHSWNNYQGSASFFVPLADGPMNASLYGYGTVSLTMSYGAVLTNKSNFAMDTGSTGILVSADRFMPGPTDTLLGPGSITYTSSGNINQGLVYLTDVVINGQNGQTATARVPVLLVQSVACEPAKQASGQCTPNSNPHNLAFMGVGFDRGAANAAAGAAVQLAPSGNPFLNLTAINGGAVPGDMRAGFIISNATTDMRTPGVTLGLTSGATANFAFVQLSPNGAPATCAQPLATCGLAGNFNPTTMTVTANGASTTGTVVQDTGINYMFLTPPAGSGLVAGIQSYAPNGTAIQISLPGQPGTAASYQFVVGQPGTPPNLLMPVDVQLVSGTPYVNTGRQFFFGFDYLYDPYGGFVGYRWNREIASQYGSVTPMLAVQGKLALDGGFWSDLPTYLMSPTTLLQTGAGTLAGDISGPGSLTLASGTMTLSGANSYTGGTNVNGGVLNIGAAGALPNGGALAVNGGLVSLNGYDQTIGTLSGTGGVLDLGSGRLTIGGTGDSTLASIVTGSGGLTLGSGNLSLTGGNTYTGPTHVLGGRLTVDGSIASDVFVGAAGALGGTGTILGDVRNAGGLTPGNSIGTLTVAGNYQQVGGSYQAEVNAVGQADRLNATGTVAIGAGSTVAVSPQAGSYAPRTTYTLLNAAGGVSGTYDSVRSLLPFLQPSLSYDAKNVYLTLQIGGFAQTALTPNQAAVGAVLDATATAATGDYATVMGALSTLSAQQGQATMNAISGQNYSGFSSSMVQGTQLFLSNFAGQAGGGGSLGGSSRVALAEACDVACDTAAPRLWSAWGGALGGIGTISNGGSNSGALTYNVSGFAGGLDRLVAPGLRIGAAVGYQNGNQWVAGFSGSGNSNTFQAGLYANYSDGPFYADAVAGYAYSANQMWRSIAIAGLAPRTAYGLTGANQVYGQVEGGYRLGLGGLADAFVTPFVRLQAYTGTQNAFTETGAGSLNLSVAQQTTNSVRTVLGAQLGGSMDLGWRDRLAMKVRLGWSHEYADTARPVTASFAGAPAAPFTTYGVAPQRDGVVLGLAATTAVAEAMNVYVRYEGEVSGQDNAHAFTAGVRLSW